MALTPKIKEILRKGRSLLPHIGMRKVKSALALLASFLLWQVVRLIFPSLEVHPIFVYIYSLMEIRDSSAATADKGMPQIRATFIALGVGLALFVVVEIIKYYLPLGWPRTAAEVAALMVGVIVMFLVAEATGCKEYGGLTASIVIVMLLPGTDKFVYALLRGGQTVAGIFIAWLINVKLLPYHGKPADNP